MLSVLILFVLGMLGVGVALGIANGWFIKNVPSSEDQGCLHMMFMLGGVVCLIWAVCRAIDLGL